MPNKSLTAAKKNLVKRKFPFIDTFNHKGPDVVRVMRNLTVGVFEHLEITSLIDVYQRISYTQHILWGAALNKYKTILVECKDSEKGLAGVSGRLDQ